MSSQSIPSEDALQRNSLKRSQVNRRVNTVHSDLSEIFEKTSSSASLSESVRRRPRQERGNPISNTHRAKKMAVAVLAVYRNIRLN